MSPPLSKHTCRLDVPSFARDKATPTSATFASTSLRPVRRGRDPTDSLPGNSVVVVLLAFSCARTLARRSSAGSGTDGVGGKDERKMGSDVRAVGGSAVGGGGVVRNSDA